MEKVKVVFRKNPVNYITTIRSIKGDIAFFDDYVKNPNRKLVCIRHDVDHDIRQAEELARAENHYEIKSTYFINHRAKYYDRSDESLIRILREIQSLGHKIGLHNNAVEGHLLTGERACDIIDRELNFLRNNGIEVTGTSAHGSTPCTENGLLNFELWEEFDKSELTNLKERFNGSIEEKYPLSRFGLLYDASLIRNTCYISDSSGRMWGYYRKRDMKCKINDLIELSHIYAGPPTTIVRNNIREVINFFNNSVETGIIQILFHPRWWKIIRGKNDGI